MDSANKSKHSMCCFPFRGRKYLTLSLVLAMWRVISRATQYFLPCLIPDANAPEPCLQKFVAVQFPMFCVATCHTKHVTWKKVWYKTSGLHYYYFFIIIILEGASPKNVQQSRLVIQFANSAERILNLHERLGNTTVKFFVKLRILILAGFSANCLL